MTKPEWKALINHGEHARTHQKKVISFLFFLRALRVSVLNTAFFKALNDEIRMEIVD